MISQDTSLADRYTNVPETDVGILLKERLDPPSPLAAHSASPTTPVECLCQRSTGTQKFPRVSPTLTFSHSSMLSIPQNACPFTLRRFCGQRGTRVRGEADRRGEAYHGKALMSAMEYVPRPGPANQSRPFKRMFSTPYSRFVSSRYPEDHPVNGYDTGRMLWVGLA